MDYVKLYEIIIRHEERYSDPLSVVRFAGPE